MRAVSQLCRRGGELTFEHLVGPGAEAELSLWPLTIAS